MRAPEEPEWYLCREDGDGLQRTLLPLHLLLQFIDQVLLQSQRSLRLLQAAAQIPPLQLQTHSRSQRLSASTGEAAAEHR